MVFPSNHPKYPNQPKGIKQVLIERGLWHNGLNLECELCKSKQIQQELIVMHIELYLYNLIFLNKNLNWKQ